MDERDPENEVPLDPTETEPEVLSDITTDPETSDDIRLRGLFVLAWAYPVLAAVSLGFLFVAMISSPMEVSMSGGLFGARAVYLYCAITAGLSVFWVWLIGSPLYAQNTGRPRPDDSVRYDRWARVTFFLLFIAAIWTFNTSFRGEWHIGLAPGHDQPQYYAYLHSWVFDQDLDFENELKAIPGAWALMANAHPERPEYNVAPIGSPILWLPFYLAAHATVLGFNKWAGTSWAADGMGPPYAVGAAFGTMVLALAGLYLTHAALRKYFSHRAAFFAVLFTAVGTPLMWYVIEWPLMSHGPSFFAGALVFFLWAGWRDTASYTRYGLLGLAIGIAMLVRPSHAALLVLPISDWIMHTARNARHELEKDESAPDEWPPFAQAGIRIALILGVMLVVFSPQLVTWLARYHGDMPEGSPMRWFAPRMGSVLYSAQHGLFAWHPLTYAGFLGIPLLWKRSRVLCLGLAGVLLLYTYFNGAIEAWWGGGSFGMRRFVGTLPFIAPGIAAFGVAVVAFVRRRPNVLVWSAAGLLLAWNATLTLISTHGYVSLYQPKTFENVWRGAAIVIHEKIGNPASYPMNLWFAMRHGVSPGRYDYLSGFRLEPFLATVEPGKGLDQDIEKLKPVQGDALKYFLGYGWYDSHGDFLRHQGNWIAYSKHPEILLPMRKGWSYTLELHVMPPPKLGTSQQAAFFLNGEQIGQATEFPENEITGLRLEIPEHLTKEGVNVIRLELAHEFRYVARTTGDVQPGAGLTVDTWREHPTTLYLMGVKLIPK